MVTKDRARARDRDEDRDRCPTPFRSRERTFASSGRLLLLALLLFVLSGCGGSGSPVDSMRRGLDKYPEYSVILNDMTSKGLFFQDYFHRYRVLYSADGKKSGEGGQPDFTQKMTDWVKVDKATYDKYQDALGMVLLAKGKDGAIDTAPQPPLFQFVDDPRFGRWETDSRGNRAWAWLAGSMVVSGIIDEIGDAFERRRHVDYRHWQDYKSSRSKGAPWYGSKNPQGKPQFGTQGTVTRKSSPGFFERQQARMAERKDSFAKKVESRMGRSRPSSSTSGGLSSSGKSSFSTGGRKSFFSGGKRSFSSSGRRRR